MTESKSQGRTVQGLVVSNKMDKTIVVKVSRRVTHPLYKKIMTKTTKMHAHDETGQCKEGDIVLIQESRPYSKTKSWKLLNILEQAS